jgi:hypothetical protein
LVSIFSVYATTQNYTKNGEITKEAVFLLLYTTTTTKVNQLLFE